MPQRIEVLLENIERDALGLDSCHKSSLTIKASNLNNVVTRPMPDGRGQNLRLHPDVLASAERTLSRSFELIRFIEAPKCVGMGQAPFVPTASANAEAGTSAMQSIVSPSTSAIAGTSGGAKRVRIKTGAVIEEVDLARSSLNVMLRGIDAYGDDDETSSIAIAMAVGGSMARVGTTNRL
jgi:hypothetical protein